MVSVVLGETIELAGDRLTKKVTREGRGPRVPSGSQVRVHYTGKLTDGTTFDSSRTRGQPLVFVVGQGNVIAGWDRGLQTMTTGEQAVLTIAPEFGYGSRGVGPIPPNATLIFEVELIDWQEPTALSKAWPLITRTLVVLACALWAWSHLSKAKKEMPPPF
jgi:FKBP-type peptidyl-prolyl cis-trans isomerase